MFGLMGVEDIEVSDGATTKSLGGIPTGLIASAAQIACKQPRPGNRTGAARRLRATCTPATDCPSIEAQRVKLPALGQKQASLPSHVNHFVRIARAH